MRGVVGAMLNLLSPTWSMPYRLLHEIAWADFVLGFVNALLHANDAHEVWAVDEIGNGIAALGQSVGAVVRNEAEWPDGRRPRNGDDAGRRAGAASRVPGGIRRG